MGGKSAFIGIVVGIAAVLVSMILEGGSLGSLINVPAFVLVVGGTLGAALICHSLEECVGLLKGLQTLMRHMPPDLKKTMARLIEVAEVARRDGLLALQSSDVGDPFANEGLQMVADGLDVKVIESVLLGRIETERQATHRMAAVFDTLGSYAPTMGIIGTVVGLINVLAHLEDTASIGHSIAGAFAATLYGIALANLVCLPVGARIRNIFEEVSRHREMMVEGILSICQGENPRVVQLKMSTFNENPSGMRGQVAHAK